MTMSEGFSNCSRVWGRGLTRQVTRTSRETMRWSPRGHSKQTNFAPLDYLLMSRHSKKK